MWDVLQCSGCWSQNLPHLLINLCYFRVVWLIFRTSEQFFCFPSSLEAFDGHGNWGWAVSVALAWHLESRSPLHCLRAWELIAISNLALHDCVPLVLHSRFCTSCPTGLHHDSPGDIKTPGCCEELSKRDRDVSLSLHREWTEYWFCFPGHGHPFFQAHGSPNEVLWKISSQPGHNGKH